VLRISSTNCSDSPRRSQSSRCVDERAIQKPHVYVELVGLGEADVELLGLTDADGLFDADGLTDGLGVWLADADGLFDADGDADADGDTDGLLDEDGLADADGLFDAEPTIETLTVFDPTIVAPTTVTPSFRSTIYPNPLVVELAFTVKLP
jgi:hypothetical protein